VRTCEYVGFSLAGCILIGYPVAYFVARHASRTKSLLLILLILPFWISYLMRMLAWINLLTIKPEDPGLINRLLMTLPFVDHPIAWSSGSVSHLTVILGLVYGYIPFFILPLFVAIDRIDRRHIEAARDLGASARSAFFRVTLPLSLPGILAGCVLIALPMFGDYYTADLVSASTQTNMIGNQIDELMRQGSEKVTGAALTLLLSIFLLGLMFYYLRTTRRAGTTAQTT